MRWKSGATTSSAAWQCWACSDASRVFFQRYEDLVSRPREVLESLCQFLGLEFEQGMIDFHESEQAVRLAESGSARANVAKPLMSANFGKYRQHLSRGEIRTVETWLGELLDRFGYARDYKPGKPRGPRVFGPQVSEPFERLINGETGPFYVTGQKRFLRKLGSVPAPVTPTYDIAAAVGQAPVVTMGNSTWSIARRIADHANANPASPALTIDGETWSYGELVNAALTLGAAWPAPEDDGPAPVTAVMAHRHASSYVGILAALLRGHTYVPVNVEHPDQRNLVVLRKSGAQRVVSGPRAGVGHGTAARVRRQGRGRALRGSKIGSRSSGCSCCNPAPSSFPRTAAPTSSSPPAAPANPRACRSTTAT